MPLSIFAPAFASFCADIHARCFAFIGDELLLDSTNQLPATTTVQEQLGAPALDYLIGHREGQPCRLLFWPENTGVPSGLARHNLRAVYGQMDEADFWIATRGKQIASWDREHRFCGVCGTPTQVAEREPARACPSCGHRHYPRVSPAVMVLIRRGNELLLARSPHFKPGVYSALAGFVEAGESCEDTIHREVMEEVGLQVKNLRWFDSQSWPFPHSLMLAFMADYAGGDIVCQPDEIEDAQWYTLDKLPDLPMRASIARRLIEAMVAQMQSETR
ncbi:MULTISPECIES: NAD(+) diphosphatase [Silvimonas]|uniref:NAD(+) diphosphatase n=1 Tax=Silvimonas TaxID=300264 RepID=UPI0024B3BE51|nr:MULTISPECIES: NAD(+) diphosphatase [Silvimonas]MDR3429900.1 NAD(+) diphosphatase [Silvimonas sp.]